MNKTTLLRTGFAALLASATAGGLIVGCDGDDSGVKPVVKPDSGPIVVPDSGPIVVPDSGPMEVIPKVILVHGANEAGAVRLCLATSPTGEPDVNSDALSIPPLPSTTPASRIPPGFGSVLPITSLPVQKLALKVIVFSADSLLRVQAGGTAKTCPVIMSSLATLKDDAGVGLTENKDYFILPTVPKGTFGAGNTYAAIVEGCPPGVEAAAKCGPGYDITKSNLRLVTYKLDTTTKGGAGNVVQFIHGAQAADPATMALGVKPFVNVTGADGGAIYLSGADAGGVTFASTSNPATVVIPTPGFKTDAPLSIATSQFGVTVAANGANIAGPIAVWHTIGAGGVTDPAFFKPGRGYTFIAVGDPQIQQPDGGPFDSKGIHFLAYDNDPVVPSL
jgi:hypothetical protein